MKISVIVPIYNVEKYLRQSLDSIGLFDRNEVEIILVNDGSTDMCLSTCRNYAQQYSNVVVIDKPNGGLSDARNVGMKIAKGEYIYFLDSDDWLVDGAIMKLYNFAVANDCQLVQGGFYYAYENRLLYDNRNINESQEPFTLTRDEAMRELIQNHYIKNFAWGKLYKASVVKKHPNPKGRFFEDSFWQHLVVNDIERYGVIPEPLYYYRQREDAISGTFSIRNIDLLEGNRQRLNFIKAYYPKYAPLMANVYYSLVKNIYCAAMRKANNETIVAYSNYLRNTPTDMAPLWFKIGKRLPFVLRFYNFTLRCINHFSAKPLKVIPNEQR